MNRLLLILLLLLVGCTKEPKNRIAASFICEEDIYIPDIVNSSSYLNSLLEKLPNQIKFSLTSYDGEDRNVILRERLNELIAISCIEGGICTIEIENELSNNETLILMNTFLETLEKWISKDEKIHIDKEIEFIKSKLQEAENHLKLSEEKLMDFNQNHPMSDDNPTHLIQKTRLIRNVEMNQQIYITLRQQFEEKRIKQHSITNHIILIDSPAFDD